jgi:Zn-dependent protease with chaperone function
MRFETKLPDDSVNVSAGTPVREAAILIAGVAGLALVFTLVAAVALELLVPRIPVSTEVRLFSLLRDSLDAGETEAAPDPRLPRVQALLDRLAARWADSPYPDLRARIVLDADPNAFAFPGGTIVVTSGLLDRIESENELAFVLGHELGHFAHRDHLLGIGRKLALTTAWRLIGLGREQGEAFVGALGVLAARRFDRRQESRADEFGLRLVVAVYGHAGGVRAVFDRVLTRHSTDAEQAGRDELETRDGRDGRAPTADDAPRDPKSRLGELSAYWSSHPQNPDRTRKLEEQIRAGGWPAEGPEIPWEQM